jgi:hydrogenase maturation protein HypF
MQLSYFLDAYGEDLPKIGLLERVKEEEIKGIMNIIRRGVNSPLTSSCGRLFDAVSALIGVRGTVDYEAQAAIELEMIADHEVKEVYPFQMQREQSPMEIDPAEIIRGVVSDLAKGISSSKISGKFHRS